MKKIFLFTTLAAATLTSCSDFLDCQPEHSFGSESFLATEAELRMYTYGFIQNNVPDIYTVSTSIQRHNQVASWGGDERSDLGFNKSKWNCLDPTVFGNRQQGGWGTGNWGALRAVNYYLDHIPNAKGAVDEKVYNHYEGVGRFWRAWFYYDMVQEFENVPWYEHEVKSNDQEALFKTQDSRQFVMDKVFEDIDFASKNCSEENKYFTSRTQINRYVALALKARICLYEGTYRKYHTELGLNDSEKWLKAAAEAAKDLMDTRKFSLVKDYKSLFQTSSLANSEVIFGVSYATDLRTHELTWRIFSPTYGNQWSMPYPFICTYLMQDGSRYTDQPGYEKFEYKQVFANRDKRLSATVLGPDYQKKVNGVMTQIAPPMNVTLSGYMPIKWALTEGGSYESQGISYNSAPMFRYAETLLVYAEAKAELGEMTSDVWDATIKLLRERGGVDTAMPTTADPYMTKYFLNRCTDKYVLEVRRERGCELAWEGLRYPDILRWKCGDILVPKGWSGIYIPKINELYDLNGDGVNDVCVYKDAKPSEDKNAVYIKVTSSIMLSEGDSGYLMYGCDYNLKWEDFMYVRPVPNSAIQKNPNLKQREGWSDI